MLLIPSLLESEGIPPMYFQSVYFALGVISEWLRGMSADEVLVTT